PVRDKYRLRHLNGLSAKVITYQQLDSEIESSDGFDYVIHLAGATRARDYEAYRIANVERTRDLLESFSHEGSGDRLNRFVLVSSQAAVGPAKDGASPVSESDPPRPVSSYGRSKLEAEKLVLSYGDRLPVTVIRPPTVFGPRDTDVLDVFRLARFRLAPCLAGPDRFVSIIYVEDLVEAIYAACVSPNASSKVYFAANPEPVVWRLFVLEVARICGYSAISVPVPLPAVKIAAAAGDLVCKLTGSAPLFRSEKFEEMKQIAWVCSSEKAYRDLDWAPKTPIAKAIEKTAAWYRKRRWI
ncbi:MAG: NAD(P)-dependent oxidoreductase, partial [Desulfomonile tiedjei]|nr:NAD(P)-dependent oxidoreductase [Desulfomonile tiedjei]